ncbi:putative DNA repair protein XPGC [Klebsormidium nitens]|uniref:Exonuclease 1 n=1 Tax=Klebsormidium nitens TaxID=105231 RepID=A0A1Y1HN98_KLENI|nr:putative DNA repair protein XPGC [Klebsormidium nitens]|eukprot:GAQ78461.1 putative DNA repair protein XPGC [Klebsormidium nitens]
MLKHNKVVPVVVFDGARLPMKAGTEAERRRNKNNSLEEARAKLAAGDERGAEEAFQRSVDITPQMALQVMKYLRREGVDFIVAPYEADAQLAALASAGKENGGIAAVITEDSDLLAYGCSTVLYKMDKYGNAEEISTERLFSSIGHGSQGPSQASSGRQQGGTCLSFRHFNQELFLGMCILAGCDFLPSIPGIGISKAHAVVNKYRNVDRALSRLKLDAKLVVPPGYAREYARARATFAHARVYDPASKRLVHLNPLPEGFAEGFGGDIDFLGPDMSPSTARAIAEGRVNPLTMEAFPRTEADTWLTRVPRAGATWQGVSAHQGATWWSGKSPKKAKGSPRSKATPAGRRPAHVDLESDADPSPIRRPEPEAPPRPRPPATVDLSAFRNFAVPRSRGLGLNQPSSNPSQAGSLDPTEFGADRVRTNGSPDRNRKAVYEGDVGFGHFREESGMVGFDGNEPPDVSMEESEEFWGTQLEPRQQSRQQESEPVSSRPVLLDLPRNPFKRRADEPASGTGWVRQLTTIAPKPRKPLSSKPPRYLNPFAVRTRVAEEGARFQEQKVSPFFAKPASPPSKPPSDPLSRASFNPPSNPPSNPHLTSRAKPAANFPRSVVSARDVGAGEPVCRVPEGQAMSPFQTKRPRKMGAGPIADFSKSPKPVPAKKRLLDDECPLGGEAPSTEERNAAGERRNQRSEGSAAPSESLTKPSDCAVGDGSEELGRLDSKPSEGDERGPPEHPAEGPLKDPQSCPVSSAPQNPLADSSEADQQWNGSEDRQDSHRDVPAPPAPVPAASSPETSVPFFGPSLDSNPEFRSDCGSQEAVLSTPSEELEPAEPFNVPEEALARGLGENSLEGLQSTWAATAASQAAADAGRERTVMSDQGFAHVHRMSASGVNGVRRERGATESAGAAEPVCGAAAGQAFVESNSGSVLDEDCVAMEEEVRPGSEAVLGTREIWGAANVVQENERTELRARGQLQKCPVDDRVDGQKDAAAVDQVEQFETNGQVGKESVDFKRVEASAQSRKVDEGTVLNGLIDLESVELRGPSSLVRLSRPMVPRRQTVKPSSILNFFKPVKVPEGGEERPGKRSIVESRGTNRKLGPSVRKKHKR